MKIAITSTGKDLNSNIDTRFGRALGFIIYDTENEKYEFVDNVQNFEAAQGAGIQAAQTVVDQNAEAVITGNCGPKAYRVLSSADINIYMISSGTVQEAIDKFKNNELTKSSNANVEGHWM